MQNKVAIVLVVRMIYRVTIVFKFTVFILNLYGEGGNAETDISYNPWNRKNA